MRRQTWTFFCRGMFNFMMFVCCLLFWVYAVLISQALHISSRLLVLRALLRQLPAPNVDQVMSAPSFGLMTWPFLSFTSALLFKSLVFRFELPLLLFSYSPSSI
ncbi:hypothetical protein BDN70DRAFT_887338 [Pholiota conissans]|uniref:Uncharacterized protein n=1 Tax=Pholiota conissans TaxID=109636 RepID=A0A9P5YR34_9AGAR|nr:hypothetical protein BDN70DRAFT_887338 [Pholiota conissans]